MPQPLSIPLILTTPPFLMALVSAEHEVTVVPLPLPPPVVPAPNPTSCCSFDEPQVPVCTGGWLVDLEVVKVGTAVAVGTEPPPVNQHEHSLDISLGLLEQFVAHAGKPVVAVTEAWVRLVQKGPAVAGLADM
jgi:hypothetical protein